MGKSDDEKSEEERSLTLFNNSTTVRQIVNASKKVKSSQSLFVHSVNKELNNKMNYVSLFVHVLFKFINSKQSN